VVDNANRDGITRKFKPLLDVLIVVHFIETTAQAKSSPWMRPHVRGEGPLKLGFKIWCCCCSCRGYLCTFQMYEGRPLDPITNNEKGMILCVVDDLLTLFQGLNHVVYCDNFFSSGDLVQRANGFPRGLIKGQTPLQW
jgi:hypothetical protein